MATLSPERRGTPTRIFGRLEEALGKPGLVWLVVLSAALLRFHRIEPEFRSSDAALSAATAMKAICADSSLFDRLEKVVFFKLGAIQPLLLFAHGWLTDALGGTLDARTWTISGVMVSCASVWCVFVLMRDVCGPTAGLVAALLLACSPAHNFTGRSLAAPWAHELALQLGILLAATRHFRSPSRSLGVLLCLLLALYIWCGNQMLGIFPVLGYALLTAYARRPKQERFRDFASSRLASPGLSVLALSAGALGYATWVAHRGHLHHALFDKRKVPGIYVGNWLSDLAHNFGYVPAAAAIASLFVLPFFVRRLFDWRLLPLVYCLCYSLPFWFLISPKATQTFTQGYAIYGQTGLLLTFVAAATQSTRTSIRAVAPMIVGVALLLATGSSVYRYYSGDLLGVKGFQGSYARPLGASAAALYIQEELRPRKGRVFSDAAHGKGLEPPVMDVYFRRPSFALLDTGQDKTPYRLFGRRRRKIAYLVTKPRNARLVRGTFPAFHRRAVVMSESGEQALLEVYARDPGEEVTLSAEAGIENYKRGFPTLCTKARRHD